MRVLVTRPEPDASRTAERLRALGHQVSLNPLLTIEPLRVGKAPDGPFTALAATSANATRVAGAMVELDALRAIPLYAVGRRTAEAAREAGFAEVAAAEGDAAALARLLTKALAAPARVLHLAGEERARELGPLLAPAGIKVDVLVLYRARAATEFAAATGAALAAGGLDAVLHYSPRSAQTFAALAVRHGLVNAVQRLRHYSLSAAVAAPLAEIGVNARVATRPDEADLLALLES